MGVATASSQSIKRAPSLCFLAAVSALALAGLAGLAATAYVALHTPRGLRLDDEAMSAVTSPDLVLNRLQEGLDLVSVGSVGLSLLTCLTIAVVQGRLDLAMGAGIVIGGTNVTTQILKNDVFSRPDLSQGPNGLPSGHTTVAVSIALAAVIVAPSAWRAIVAIGGSATATFVGVALVLGRWHRPSDVIAAIFVCLVWAAAGLLAAALVGRRSRRQRVGSASAHGGALLGVMAVGTLLLLWGVRPQPGLRDLGLGLVSLGTIGLFCALSVGAVAHLADRHLG